MRIVSLETTDLSEVLSLQHAIAPRNRRWTLEEARHTLCDIGRAGGKNVLVANEGEKPVALMGWVTLAVPDDGHFYVAPLIGAHAKALRLLVDRAIELAVDSGALRVRVSAWPEEQVKARVLDDAGCAVGYHVVRLAHSLTERTSVPRDLRDRGLIRIRLDDADPERFRRLHNESFRGVPNAAPMTREMAEEAIADQRLWREGTQLWADREGVYRAFALLHADGLLDAIAVDPAQQGCGIGLAVLQTFLHEAAAAGHETVCCDVASTNIASLRLHEKAGFKEQERRSVWEKTLGR